MSPLLLAGKNALITGGSRGIGAAIARRFACEGASVTLVARDADALRTTCDGLARPGAAQRHGYVVADLAGKQETHKDEDEDIDDMNGHGPPPALWDGILAQCPPELHVFVSSHGRTDRRLFYRMTEADIGRTLAVNLGAVAVANRAVVKRMMRQREGCIINISSLLAVKGGRGSVAYAASKAGVLGLTRSLASEVGRSKIRVNAILPGYIETRMTEDLDEPTKKEILKGIPVGRFGTADEVADAAAFLAKNPYASNCVLNLDGGLSAT